MSSTSTPTPPTGTPARDEALLDIGKKCSFGHCGMVDFLPFKCEHCALPFCADHFRVEQHHCEHYDESKHDRVAPHCPLCDEPIAIPPGQDPTIRFQQHVDTKCSVTTGRKPGASSTPRCGNKRCNKALITPIRCDTCRKQFCPSHRFPSDHTCVSSTTNTTTKSGSARPSASAATKPGRPAPSVQAAQLKKTASEVSDTLGAKANAAQAAIKRSMANVQANVNVQASKVAGGSGATGAGGAKPATGSGTGVGAVANPFSKTNRRAKAEQESRRKAMQQRAKKGLLSEEEKLMLAREEAEAANSKEGKEKECVVM